MGSLGRGRGGFEDSAWGLAPPLGRWRVIPEMGVPGGKQGQMTSWATTQGLLRDLGGVQEAARFMGPEFS